MMLKFLSFFLSFFLIFTSTPLYSASMKELTSAKTAIKASEEMVQERESFNFDDEIGQHAVGISFGQTSLRGNYRKRGVANKLSFGFLYNFTASYAFDLLIDLHYSSHEKNGERVTLPGLSFGAKAKLWQMDAFYPFLLGGLGFYLPYEKQKKSDDTFIKSSAKVIMGLHAGLGAELKLAKEHTIGAMAVLYWPFKSEQTSEAKDVTGAYWKLLLTFIKAF